MALLIIKKALMYIWIYTKEREPFPKMPAITFYFLFFRYNFALTNLYVYKGDGMHEGLHNQIELRFLANLTMPFDYHLDRISTCSFKILICSSI